VVVGFVLALVILIWAMIFASIAFAHDHEHPELDEWYATLRQPDFPLLSCCGEADAYWCDDYYSRDGKAYCRITDDRVVPGRPSVPMGTEVFIPDYKLKFDRGNPTGHAVVFMSRHPYNYVYCFVQNGGV
jgi:hypothetical protein